MIVALIVVVLVLGLLGIGTGTRWWRDRHPEDLRGDWWARFEADFERYARGHARNPR